MYIYEKQCFRTYYFLFADTKTLLYLHRSKLKYYAEHTEATPISKQSHISRLCSDRF